ncbi:PGF-pre-PGF domain-containing protein [Natrarchaeobaculum sulfurireducens]|uniref:PGF-pre-PGF domain-containing protein n=1 Tax=Natrarchaeobaculum sulfurireducens TaxID=2044521 RepID=UPI000E3B8EFE|nr:PGF-pre-PGF domain-containing protein [Natrarchaeobaculum sulfurireducens]
MTANRVLAVAVVLVIASIAGVVPGGTATPASQSVADTDRYVLEQGDVCQEIEPLESDGTVHSFYDYRNHETHPDTDDNLYSSYGTQHLQEDDTSILMLHEGADGTSLVVVHDRLEGTSAGGVVTFDVVGTPPEADWVVRDDEYDAPTNMAEWRAGDGWLGADWIWADGRTDGGAINGGLDDEFALTIYPAFNEDSPFYGDETLHDPDWHGDGRIDDWQVLSGDLTDPDRTSLSLSEPVTIRTGTCETPSTTYNRADDGIVATVDVTDAVQSSTTSSEPVRFDSVTVADVDPADGPFVLERDTDRPPTPDHREVLSELAFAGDRTDGAATVTFSLDADWLEDEGVDAEEVGLHEADGDEWSDADTEIRSASDGRYQFEATVTSLEGLIVTIPQDDGSSGNDRTDGESGGDGEDRSNETDADRDGESGTDSESETGTFEASLPLFALGVVVVLALGVVLLVHVGWRH